MSRWLIAILVLGLVSAADAQMKRTLGVRPNRPILFTVPVTGADPIKLSVKGLPDGAKFDSATGRISGSVAVPGTYDVTITAKNKHGKAESVLKLVVGDTLALTPPMGWNSWNCFASAVSDVKIRQAAEAMVNSGLIKHGWSYINIDDFWQNRPHEKNDQTLIGPERDANGKIVANKRFPDMKALADYVHGLYLIGQQGSPAFAVGTHPGDGGAFGFGVANADYPRQRGDGEPFGKRIGRGGLFGHGQSRAHLPPLRASAMLRP